MADRFSRVMGYLGAGMRRIDDIKRESQQTWDAFYDTHGSPEIGFLPWEREYVERFIMPGAGVLLVGCGSGRDLLPLLERGCRVTGIDPSRSGLAIADRLLRAHGRSAPLIHGFFEDISLTGTFDVVVFSYCCYATIAMGRTRVAALAKAASLLTPGGHIIVSFAAPTRRPRGGLTRLGRWAGTLSRSDWRIEPGDVVWDNRTSRPSFSFTHVFEENELDREAAAAHLRVVWRAGDSTTNVLVFARP
jgi:SAM-dependent methyltransferase